MPEIEFPTILAGEGYEYGVMMRRRPGLHRTLPRAIDRSIVVISSAYSARHRRRSAVRP